MTVAMGPSSPGHEPDAPFGADEALVARMANELFQSGFALDGVGAPTSAPGLGDAAAMSAPPDVPSAVPPGAPHPVPAPPAGHWFAADPRDARMPMVSPGPATGFIDSMMRSFGTCDGSGAGVIAALGAISELGAASSDYYFLPGAAPAAPSHAGVGGHAQTVDASAVRSDFPALHQQVHGKPLVWLDNAATTQKPQSVIDAVTWFYEHDNSNVHRGAHTLAARATDAYEAAREKVQSFIGAASIEEIIFVRGTTEAINLVAQSFGRQNVGPGDEILLTQLEHHSNIVPWQMLANEKGAHLRVVPLTDRGEVILEEYARLLSPRTRIVAVSQVSNALGTIVPVATMADMAHRHGATVVVDGAQAVAHMPVDVRSLGADFYAFSGHKVFAPTGVGVLYGRKELLEDMPPWQGGGQMIQTVTFDHSTYNKLPYKFEAGTGTLAGAVGLGAAIDYVGHLGMANVQRHEHALLEYGTQLLRAIPGVHLIGTAPEKAGVMSFVLDGMPTEDVGRFLDGEGIAVRAGHHCAQPALARYGLTSTVRPSLALYNTLGDMDALGAAVRKASQQARPT